MLIQYIQNSLKAPNHSLINHDMTDYLEIGSVYEVYGIEIKNKFTYYFIYDNQHLLPVPSSLFQILDGRISPFWIVRCPELGNMTIFPPLFYEENFFENFSEWEEKERTAFAELRKSFKATAIVPIFSPS